MESTDSVGASESLDSSVDDGVRGLEGGEVWDLCMFDRECNSSSSSVMC